MQRALTPLGAAIKITAKVARIKAVSLPMPGYTQASTPVSPARYEALPAWEHDLGKTCRPLCPRHEKAALTRRRFHVNSLIYLGVQGVSSEPISALSLNSRVFPIF